MNPGHSDLSMGCHIWERKNEAELTLSTDGNGSASKWTRPRRRLTCVISASKPIRLVSTDYLIPGSLIG